MPRFDLRPFSRLVPGPASAPQRVFVTTQDGVRLVLHRLPPTARGPGAGRPVLLLHGLGANRSLYLMPERSLAAHLASLGFDAYVAELRGAGESGAPEGPWDLEDYLDQDLPALLQGIRRHSGHDRVLWVGHSMGGLLLACYVIRHRDHGVERGVAVGSALDYRVGRSGFQRLFQLRRFLSRVPAVPFGPLAHFAAPLLGRFPNPFDAFNFWAPNVEPHLVRAAHAHGFEWIPTALLLSLSGTFEEAGLKSRDGTLSYLSCATRATLPLLLLAGTRDAQCPVEAVEATAARIGPNAQVAAFGRAYGHAEEYGHCDLLVGRRAPLEVWPHITRFLQAG